MPLSSNSTFGIRPMTESINKLPTSPTIIRSLGLFKPEYHTTTYVTVESKNGVLSLVSAVPRGTPGAPVSGDRGDPQTFNMLHLPKNDVVRADDVQNVRAFGSDNKAETVAEKVNGKLLGMKSDIEYTREHLMLGALKGKILDADGSTIEDLYTRFGLTRKVFTWQLSAATTEVGKQIDQAKTFLGKKRMGESISGWYVLASEEYMEKFVYHESMKRIYERYQEAALYRGESTNVSVVHKGVTFIQYDHVFPSGEKIPDGEAIMLPKGTRKTFKENFAPGDMNETVNTKAKPYYASREKLQHGKGWDLHAQSNPLPLVLRPELLATIKLS